MAVLPRFALNPGWFGTVGLFWTIRTDDEASHWESEANRYDVSSTSIYRGLVSRISETPSPGCGDVLQTGLETLTTTPYTKNSLMADAFGIPILNARVESLSMGKRVSQ